MIVRRLGGAYGGKISRATHVAAACAIAASALNKPVRIQLDLATNMTMVGGRLPYYCKYKVFIHITFIIFQINSYQSSMKPTHYSCSFSNNIGWC